MGRKFSNKPPKLAGHVFEEAPWAEKFWDAEENRERYGIEFDDAYVSCGYRFYFKCPECGHKWGVKASLLKTARESTFCPACRQARAEKKREIQSERTAKARAAKKHADAEESGKLMAVSTKSGSVFNYDSAEKAGKDFRCSPQIIAACCNESNRAQKVAFGFLWYWNDDGVEWAKGMEEAGRIREGAMSRAIRKAAKKTKRTVEEKTPRAHEGEMAQARQEDGGKEQEVDKEARKTPPGLDDGKAAASGSKAEVFYKTFFDLTADTGAKAQEILPVVIEAVYSWVAGKEDLAQEAKAKVKLAEVVDWDTACAWNPDLAISRASSKVLAGCIKDALADYSETAMVEDERTEGWRSVFDDDFVDLGELGGGEDPAVVPSGFAFGMDASEHGVRVRTKCDGPAHSLPRVWEMRLDEGLENDQAGRAWSTVVKAASEEGVCHVWVGVATVGEDGGDVPARNQPRVVGSLLALKGVQAGRDGVQLNGTASEVLPNDQKSYLRMVEEAVDERRPVPFVLVCSNAAGNYGLDCAKLAKRLSGVATVCTLPFKDAGLKRRLDQSFSNDRHDLRPVAGAVNVYWGACREGDLPARTVVSTTERGRDKERAAVLSEVTETVLKVTAQCAGDVIGKRGGKDDAEAPKDGVKELPGESKDRQAKGPSGASETRHENGKSDEDGRKAVDVLKKAVKEAAGLLGVEGAGEAGERETLEELLSESQEAQKAQKEEIDGLKCEIAGLRGKNASLELRAKSLKEDVERMQGLESGAASLEEIPASMVDVVNLAARTFTNRLVFTPKALASAKTDETGGYCEAWRIFRALDRVLWPILFEEDQEISGRAADMFKDETGFEIGWNESELTENSSKLKAARKVEWNGKELMASRHVKGQSGGRTNKLRIYFREDRDEKVIVIGPCGNHLDTEGTRRRSMK